MGVTIECIKTHRSCDMGYGGFLNFREKVAHLVNDEFGKHYEKLSTPQMLNIASPEHSQAVKEFDRETIRLINKYRISKKAVDFLLQSDCGGRISPSTCKIIYSKIKDYDDDICYGYAWRDDCAMFRDLKAIFKDCCDTNSYLIYIEVIGNTLDEKNKALKKGNDDE